MRRCACGRAKENRGPAKRKIVTTLGRISIQRRWWQCRCGHEAGCYVADHVLGVEGSLSHPLERRICRLGADVSFAKTEEHLQDLLGLRVGEETIRHCCEGHGKRLVRWQHEDRSIAQEFARSAGDIEFTADAGKVNTLAGGWKDLKIAVFQKRACGSPCDVSQWATRPLPEASVSIAWADITKSDRFRVTWRRMAKHLGVRRTAEVHVLGDGAAWIWRSVSAVLAGSRETLDIFHALEHVAKAGDKLYGEGTEASHSFLDRGRSLLLESGWSGITRLVAGEIAHEDTPLRRQPLDELIKYFAPHMRRIEYKRCLVEGRAIGSGVVEGWAKTLGLRLKARGARWRKSNAVAMAALGCVRHGSQWTPYWAAN